MDEMTKKRFAGAFIKLTYLCGNIHDNHVVCLIPTEQGYKVYDANKVKGEDPRSINLQKDNSFVSIETITYVYSPEKFHKEVNNPVQDFKFIVLDNPDAFSIFDKQSKRKVERVD